MTDAENSLMLRAAMFCGWRKAMFIAQEAEQAGAKATVGVRHVTYDSGAQAEFYNIVLE